MMKNNNNLSPEIINILKPHEVVRKKIYRNKIINNFIYSFFLILFLALICKTPIFAVFTPLYAYLISRYNIKQGSDEKIFIKTLKKCCLESFLEKYKNIKYHTIKTNEALLKRSIAKSGYLNCAKINEYSYILDDFYEINLNNKKINLWDYKLLSMPINSSTNECVITKFSGISLLFNLNKEIKDNIIISTKGISQKAKRALAYVFAIMVELIIFYFYLKCLINNILPQGVLYDSDYMCIFVIVYLFIVICITIYSAIKYDPRKNYKKDFLEDVVFNKNYNIELTNHTEARYILTPAFMEALNKLKTLYKSNKLYCSINSNKMFIMISSRKNSFEIGKINSTLFNQKTINDFYSQIESLLNALDRLAKY